MTPQHKPSVLPLNRSEKVFRSPPPARLRPTATKGWYSPVEAVEGVGRRESSVVTAGAGWGSRNWSQLSKEKEDMVTSKGEDKRASSERMAQRKL